MTIECPEVKTAKAKRPMEQVYQCLRQRCQTVKSRRKRIVASQVDKRSERRVIGDYVYAYFRCCEIGTP